MPAIPRRVPETSALALGRPLYSNESGDSLIRKGRPRTTEDLVDLFNLPGDFTPPAEGEDYTNQTQDAISAVLNGERWVDLPPASANVRRLQHEMARQAELVSHSYGKEPNRRVRIFRE